MTKQKKEKKAPTEASTDQADKEQEVVVITYTAAKLVCEIITACAKRGAFNPNELSLVGTLFDQLNAQLPEDQRLVPAPEQAAPEQSLEKAEAETASA